MNRFVRFMSFGLLDADRRVASALSRPAVDAADRYLWDSTMVRAIDRATRRLQETWSESRAGRALDAVAEAFSGEDWTARYQALALLLAVAATVHVLMTLMQGPRPGWFWLVIPAMALGYAGLVFLGSRSSTK